MDEHDRRVIAITKNRRTVEPLHNSRIRDCRTTARQGRNKSDRITTSTTNSSAGWLIAILDISYVVARTLLTIQIPYSTSFTRRRVTKSHLISKWIECV